MTEANRDEMTLAPGVLETIVGLAAQEVEGVETVGSSMPLRGLLGKSSGISAAAAEDGSTDIDVHVQVRYGYPLPELAASLRRAVYDAVSSQIGIKVGRIDVYIDGLKFDA